jgi:beta-glucanase (GH16 family)
LFELICTDVGNARLRLVAARGRFRGRRIGRRAGRNRDVPARVAGRFRCVRQLALAARVVHVRRQLGAVHARKRAFKNGLATLSLTPQPSDTAEPYRGVEMRSLQTITYGKIESRIRFAKGSAVVSSLVLIYTPYPADNWNELDIEFLGRYSDRAQLNEQVYEGPPVTPPVSQSVSPTQDPAFVSLGFDPSADFHVYAIEWTPADVRFTVDGALVHTWSAQIARMKLPQNILLTIWASNVASWAGPVGADTAPTSADYDWIHVYNWVPNAP